MERFEQAVSEAGALDAAGGGADIFFELGMMCSTGSSVPADYVSAHKWFNLAARLMAQIPVGSTFGR